MLLSVSLTAHIRAHGAMTFPKPRNSADGALAPWTKWSYPCDATHKGDNCEITFCENGKNCEGSCPLSAHNGAVTALNASNGQSCYWFSNGCTIGCDACDGTHNHYGHGSQSWLYDNMTQSEIVKAGLFIKDPFTPAKGMMTLDPKTRSLFNISSNCEHRTTNATVCAESLRTCNTQSECGGPDDYYYFSPWRAPGSAPVIDSCGSAGGRHPGQGTGGAGAQFQNSSVAKAGDVGSKLPAMPSQATWTAGVSYEVGWTVMANHGGGYAYRLASASEPLTEATFRKLPLNFVGNSTLRWGGDHSTQLSFDSEAKGWQTSEGTTPAGSQWRKNPIPSGLWAREGASFEPVCEESKDCIAGFTANARGQAQGPWLQGVCKCSGWSNGGPLLPNLEVVDSVMVPKGTKPGKYILQWRWDCEESDQVWASCSDVTIV